MTTATKTKKTPKIKYWFDEEAADKAAEFFPEFLTHAKGEHAGQAFEL